MGELYQIRMRGLWSRIGHLLWVRKETLGQARDWKVCQVFGGHVRFGAACMDIARWSYTEHLHYRRMMYEEFLALAETGQFPLRTMPQGVITRVAA